MLIHVITCIIVNSYFFYLFFSISCSFWYYSILLFFPCQVRFLYLSYPGNETSCCLGHTRLERWWDEGSSALRVFWRCRHHIFPTVELQQVAHAALLLRKRLFSFQLWAPRSTCTCEQSKCVSIEVHLLFSQVKIDLKTPLVSPSYLCNQFFLPTNKYPNHTPYLLKTHINTSDMSSNIFSNSWRVCELVADLPWELLKPWLTWCEDEIKWMVWRKS